jgi:hypothetical protein
MNMGAGTAYQPIRLARDQPQRPVQAKPGLPGERKQAE